MRIGKPSKIIGSDHTCRVQAKSREKRSRVFGSGDANGLQRELLKICVSEHLHTMNCHISHVAQTKPDASANYSRSNQLSIHYNTIFRLNIVVLSSVTAQNTLGRVVISQLTIH